MSNTPSIDLYRPDRGDFQWDVYVNSNFTKIDTHIGGLNANIDDLPYVERHSSTFNGATGRTITLTKEVDNINQYGVKITATSRGSSIGDVWVSKEVDDFTVYCSGGNTSDTFEAIVYFMGEVNNYGGAIYRRYYVSPSTSITDHSNASTVGSLAYVLAQMSGAAGIIEFPGNRTYNLVNSGVTMPAGSAVFFQPGAVLNVGSGVTLTLNCEVLNGRQTIFEGDGSFTRTGWIENVYPEWWGNDNDTIAIRRCHELMDSDYGGGINLGPRTYNVYPQSAGTKDYCIKIEKDNIDFHGQGMGITCISTWALNGNDPETNWEIIGGEVWRGYAIWFQGSLVSGSPRVNNIFRDFELTGNTEYTGPYNGTTIEWPADPVTGESWDITHRAIYGNYQEGVDAGYYDNVQFIGLNVHNFKGELLGGAVLYQNDHSRFFVRGCRLHHTNANCWSYNGQNHVVQNEMSYCTYGVEDIYRPLPSKYTSNIIRDGGIACVAFANGYEGPPYGPVKFCDNIVKTAEVGDGIYIGRPTDIEITNNHIEDCGQDTNMASIKIEPQSTQLQNVTVKDNMIVANNSDIYRGITIDCGTGLGDADCVIVTNNHIYLTENGYDLGYELDMGLLYYGDINEETCKFDGNWIRRATNSSASGATVYDYLMEATGNQNILVYLSAKKAFYCLDIYVEILNETCVLSLNTSVYDHNSTQYNLYHLQNEELEVGNYAYGPYTMLSGDGTNITFGGNPTVANNVRISANIRLLEVQA